MPYFILIVCMSRCQMFLFYTVLLISCISSGFFLTKINTIQTIAQLKDYLLTADQSTQRKKLTF
jgi:hypothetical protein